MSKHPEPKIGSGPDPARPVILCLSGHDPSGGAGIQADVESITAQGCLAATAITCLTVQNTVNVQQLNPVSSGLFEAQARAVLEDIAVAAIKIGLLASEDICRSAARILKDYPALPVVLDPVLAAGGGATLARRRLIDSVAGDLLPLATLVTPNRQEARQLAASLAQQEIRDEHEQASPENCAARILQTGCGAVLVTGADESSGKQVHNLLYQKGSQHTYHWPRLAGQFHGSGCTLAAAAAARIALGEDIPIALQQAQAYTWKSLQQAQTPGQGQAVPVRVAACQC